MTIQSLICCQKNDNNVVVEEIQRQRITKYMFDPNEYSDDTDGSDDTPSQSSDEEEEAREKRKRKKAKQKRRRQRDNRKRTRKMMRMIRKKIKTLKVDEDMREKLNADLKGLERELNDSSTQHMEDLVYEVVDVLENRIEKTSTYFDISKIWEDKSDDSDDDRRQRKGNRRQEKTKERKKAEELLASLRSAITENIRKIAKDSVSPYKCESELDQFVDAFVANFDFESDLLNEYNLPQDEIEALQEEFERVIVKEFYVQRNETVPEAYQ